jgi:hypothetical protein
MPVIASLTFRELPVPKHNVTFRFLKFVLTIVFVLTVGMFQAMLPADVLRMDRLRGLGTTTRISCSDSIDVTEI